MFSPGVALVTCFALPRSQLIGWELHLPNLICMSFQRDLQLRRCQLKEHERSWQTRARVDKRAQDMPEANQKKDSNKNIQKYKLKNNYIKYVYQFHLSQITNKQWCGERRSTVESSLGDRPWAPWCPNPRDAPYKSYQGTLQNVTRYAFGLRLPVVLLSYALWPVSQWNSKKNAAHQGYEVCGARPHDLLLQQPSSCSPRDLQQFLGGEKPVTWRKTLVEQSCLRLINLFFPTQYSLIFRIICSRWSFSIFHILVYFLSKRFHICDPTGLSDRNSPDGSGSSTIHSKLVKAPVASIPASFDLYESTSSNLCFDFFWSGTLLGNCPLGEMLA